MDENERVALLEALCALLPEHDATLLRSMSADDPITYVEAYSAFQHAGVKLSRSLRLKLLAALDAQIDASERRLHPSNG